MLASQGQWHGPVVLGGRARESGAQGNLQLRDEFKASMGYVRPCFKI